MKATVEKMKATEGWVFTPDEMPPEFISDIYNNRISVYQKTISRTVIFPEEGTGNKKTESPKS